MTDDSRFIMKKEVFRTLFDQGFAINRDSQPLLWASGLKPLQRGERCEIKLLIGDVLCSATLRNQNIITPIGAGHSDIVQILYSANSEAAKQMKLAFPNSYNYLAAKYQENPNATLRLPDDVKEYFILNSTSMPGVFEIQSIRYYDFAQAQREFSVMEEAAFESWTDDTAGYRITESMRKVRKLDRSIGDSLKQLYDYRCQITGEKIGEEYGDGVIEAHHIEFFTTSLNNDSSNIIILSPNFHRIIHKNLPVFDREHLEFRFQNGVVEKIRLDKHLKL